MRTVCVVWNTLFFLFVCTGYVCTLSNMRSLRFVCLSISIGVFADDDFDLAGNGDTWTDSVAGSDDDPEPTAAVVAAPKFASDDPPATLIYVCGGSSEELEYCEFPFTTLAGNEYSHSCADQVEDNPDVFVDRPWCFVSASRWGFCDCKATIGFTYITQSHSGGGVHLVVQAHTDYPGTIWCSLSDPASALPKLSDITNSTNPAKFAGGAAVLTDHMIYAQMDVQIEFTVNATFAHVNSFLACQAFVPAIATQPEPIGLILGTVTDFPDSTDEDTKPKLVTSTNGATIYSLIILILLGGFIGTRYALDQRKLLMFELLADQ